MMSEKYYTPTIEEFHVGFEYELFENFDVLPEAVWHKQVYGPNGKDPESLDHISDTSKTRVKYLDKSDFESLGFKEDVQNSFPERLNFEFHVEGYTLGIVLYNLTELTIYKWDGRRENNLFSGNIKNKSELVRLFNQLNIL